MKKRCLISLTATLIAASLCLSFGITYGAYVKYAKVNQGIDVAGSRYIYLKPTSEWAGGSPVFYACYCNGTAAAKWEASISTIGTGNDIIYLFPVKDSTAYRDIVFVRYKTGTSSPGSWAYPDPVWNQTEDLTNPSGKSANIMYTITKCTYGVKISEGSWGAFSA